MSAAEVVVRLATALLRDEQARYREQWAADLEGAAELGMNPLGVAFGALALAVTRRGHTMLPIGPLAIALRRFGTRGQAAVLLSISTLALLGGVLLLMR
jgi:hypothetical protein